MSIFFKAGNAFFMVTVQCEDAHPEVEACRTGEISANLLIVQR